MLSVLSHRVSFITVSFRSQLSALRKRSGGWVCLWSCLAPRNIRRCRAMRECGPNKLELAHARALVFFAGTELHCIVAIQDGCSLNLLAGGVLHCKLSLLNVALCCCVKLWIPSSGMWAQRKRAHNLCMLAVVCGLCYEDGLMSQSLR